jgi:AcrR family transcriptional regulator
VADKGRPRSFDRETALRTAMLKFWEKGFDGASLADLTTAMGINSPSLYAAFGSKEELYLESLALYAGEVGGEIWSALDETADVAPSLREISPRDDRRLLPDIGATGMHDCTRCIASHPVKRQGLHSAA